MHFNVLDIGCNQLVTPSSLATAYGRFHFPARDAWRGGMAELGAHNREVMGCDIVTRDAGGRSRVRRQVLSEP